MHFDYRHIGSICRDLELKVLFLADLDIFERLFNYLDNLNRFFTLKSKNSCNMMESTRKIVYHINAIWRFERFVQNGALQTTARVLHAALESLLCGPLVWIWLTVKINS